jgi:hypothetical protein
MKRLLLGVIVAVSLASSGVAADRHRIGAQCNDGTTSKATGSGACSHHHGVMCWLYNDGTCTKP